MTAIPSRIPFNIFMALFSRKNVRRSCAHEGKGSSDAETGVREICGERLSTGQALLRQPAFSPRRSVFALALLACGVGAAHGAEQFSTLIVQDAAPVSQGVTPFGLTEFRSVHGVLNVKMTAADDFGEVQGGIMPANPQLGPTYGAGQLLYPRLGYTCDDGTTHTETNFAGPLLRVFPGDRIHIEFTNNLFTQRTNLHFHGLPVSPHADNKKGAFADFVNLPYVLPTAPGDTRVYDFVVPASTLPGPYWYHAHAHGVAEMQVACGLSGALYVEGAVPAYVKSLTDRSGPLLKPAKSSAAAAAKQLLADVETTLSQLPHHLLVLKDFWTPGLGPINGPLEQSVNGKVTYTNLTVNLQQGTPYQINYGPVDQIWEITNQSPNLNYALQFTGVSGDNIGFYVLGRDGMPPAAGMTYQFVDHALMVPPAGRATVVVPTSQLGQATVNIIAQPVDTAGGDVYFEVGEDITQNPNPWNLITLTPAPGSVPAGVKQWQQLAPAINQTLSATSDAEKPAKNLTLKHPIDAVYDMFEPVGAEPAPPRLPAEPTQFSFYRLADKHGSYWKQPADTYDNFEPPIVHLTPGKPQRWIIQNDSPEWHAFHLHQVHFRVERFSLLDPRNAANPELSVEPPQDNLGNPFYSVNQPPPAGSGKTPGEPYYSGPVDTVSIPNNMQVFLTVPMNEGPQIAGEFVMHCHILEHEDGGMMANVTAGDFTPEFADASKSPQHLPPLEVAVVKFTDSDVLEDAAGKDCGPEVFKNNEFSLVTFGYTTCDGSCPRTMEKCTSALAKLTPEIKARILPCFVSLDLERDTPAKLKDYAGEHELTGDWKLLLDTNLAATHAFGAQRRVTRKADGSISIRHSTTIYLIDRTMHIRAAFDDDDTVKTMTERIEKELHAPDAAPTAPAGAVG